MLQQILQYAGQLSGMAPLRHPTESFCEQLQWTDSLALCNPMTMLASAVADRNLA